MSSMPLRDTLRRLSLPLGASLACLSALGLAPPAQAFGTEGHAVIALIAAHYLTAAVRTRAQALLDTDASGLTRDTSLESEASWADRYREARAGRRTRDWHFVNLELGVPDLTRACFGRPALPAGIPASQGPARDCAVDKIDEFSAELADPRTTRVERRLALQFLLHLVGDLHQPLHAADDHDEGGNRLRVRAAGARPGSLHGYWDTVFVRDLDRNPRRLAAALIARITQRELRAWRAGTAADWARESHAIAVRIAYGQLPRPGPDGRYRLPARYVRAAESAEALQLSRAGVRLALLLNRALLAPAAAQQRADQVER